MTYPITVTLSDGRVLAFVDHYYMRAFGGFGVNPPEPAEVTVNAAWWLAPDGAETECTPDELEALHDGPEYDAILRAVESIDDAERAAAIGDGWGGCEDEP
jgi:hypothetical protein